MPRLSLRARRFFFALKIAKRSFHRRKDQSFLFFFCERETELAMNIFMVEYHGNEVNVKISLIFNDW